MSHPVWYDITDVASLRALLDQRDRWYAEASRACNKVAYERDDLKARIAELETQLAEVDPALIAFRNVFYRYAPEGVECSEKLHNAYQAAFARQQARKANP